MALTPMAIQSRTFVYVFSRLAAGRIDTSTKFLRAVDEQSALEQGRRLFRPLATDTWSEKAVEVYRAAKQ
jgi:hypothetical protein